MVDAIDKIKRKLTFKILNKLIKYYCLAFPLKQIKMTKAIKMQLQTISNSKKEKN